MSINDKCTKADMAKSPLPENCRKALVAGESPYDTTDQLDLKNVKDQRGILIVTIILSVLIFIFGGGYLLSKKDYTPLQMLNKDAFDFLAQHTGKLPDNPIRPICSIVIGLIYIMLVAAIIIIIICAYDIKKSYQIGANLEKHCNNIFMEKERPDFHVYSCYMDIYEYRKKQGVFSNNNGSVKIRLKNAYELLLSSIIVIILVASIVITGLGGGLYISKNQKEYGNIVLIVFCFIALCILVVVWVKGNYNIGDKNNALLLNPYTDILFKYDINNYWKGAINKIVANHRVYILFILTTVIISLSVINTFIEDNYKIPDSFIWRVGIMLAILFVIIPLFMKSAQAFQLNITSTYDAGIKKLNELINDYKDDNNETWQRIKKELISNINADERFSGTVNLKDYDGKLYQYLTHIVNKDNIVGIPIPQQIKPMIRPEYLAGERSIELKETLMNIHNIYLDNKNVMITKDSITNKYGSLRTYLKDDVRIKIGDDKGEKELQLLNNYILLSDNFKKGNPFPPDIVMQLEKMRKDTTIKKTVDEYFSKIRTITSIILIFIAYYIYHNIYPNSVDVKIQYVSIFLFVLMVILGIVGWWMKEIWL